MKKTLSIIALLLIMMVQNIGATVTITAPERPAVLGELKEGESYYLYNVGKGSYMARNTSSSSYVGWSDTPATFRLDKVADETFAFWQGSGYIGSGYSVYWNYTSDINNQYMRYRLTQNQTGDYFITDTYENDNIGYNPSNSSYISQNVGSSSYASWFILPASSTAEDLESAWMYHTKRNLYDAIVAADAKGIHIERYEDIYKDATKTRSELQAKVNELNNSQSLSETHRYLFREWSDYPILITDLDKWGKDGSYNRLHTYNSGSGTTNTLKTSVYIDEPSTFVFSLSCSGSWTNEAMMPFKVYVDGEVVYDYKGEKYRYSYDSYFSRVLHGPYYYNEYGPYSSNYNFSSGDNIERNRHFIELAPGHHLVDIETTQAYNGTSSFETWLWELGVEKTPEITVHNATVGSLGEEVLQAMDNHPLIPETNMRNTRKLKISGKMGDADWAEIYNMDMLFSLDLTDAEITEIKKEQLSLYAHSSLGFLHELKLPKTLKTIGREAFYSSYIENTDIPETVESIGDYAFAATRLKEANIPNVKTIGHNAFRECTSLEKVVMKNVESMGINTFSHCYNIKDITFEGTLTNVPQETFSWCDEIENISIPETVTLIESYAFYGNRKSTINKLPDNLQTIQVSAFLQNYQATFELPQGLKTIGANAFESCHRIKGDIPASVTFIGSEAFLSTQCLNMPDTLHLPANATFGSSLFESSNVKNVVIPEDQYNFNVSKAFANCKNLSSIKFMSSTKVSASSDFIDGLTKKDIKILVPDYLRITYMRDSYWMDFTIEGFSTLEMKDVVIRQNLQVSQHNRFEGTPNLTSVANTTLTIIGTTGMELNNVTLNNNLVADTYSQLWSSSDQIHINGLTSENFYTAANKWYFLCLPFDCDLSKTVNNDAQYAIRYYDGANRAQNVFPTLVDDGETIVYLYNVNKRAYVVGGNEYGTRASITPTNKAQFKIVNNGNGTWTLYNDTRNWLSMFTSGSDVWMDNSNTSSSNAWVIKDLGNGSYEILNNDNPGAKLGLSNDDSNTRLYMDSDVQATTWAFVSANNIIKSNWKDFDCSKDVIKAGTGFILMTSKDSWTSFYSVDNGTKQTVFFSADNENNEQHFQLQKHVSETSANRGWNLVGNPYPNYYNNHKISFSAPITLWTGSTYQAYSLRDDDVALKPCQAFFVQCPEDVAEISFPSAGRQTSSVITDQANAKGVAKQTSDRRLIDLSLSNDKGDDKTRIVINEDSKMAYELTYDAAKFMSIDSSMPQLYSLDSDATKYSINERPMAEGSVQLGAFFPTNGEYTMSIARSNAGKVMLTDNMTGETVNISEEEYVFDAKAGTSDSRFVISFEDAATATAAINASTVDNDIEKIYTIDGREATEMMSNKTYILRSKKGVRKVLFK